MTQDQPQLEAGQAAVAQQDTVQQPAVVQDGGPRPKDDSYMCLSATSAFCNPLFGVIAVYMSMNSRKLAAGGDPMGAVKWGKRAKNLAITGIILYFLIVSVLVGLKIYYG